MVSPWLVVILQWCFIDGRCFGHCFRHGTMTLPKLGVAALTPKPLGVASSAGPWWVDGSELIVDWPSTNHWPLMVNNWLTMSELILDSVMVIDVTWHDAYLMIHDSQLLVNWLNESAATLSTALGSPPSPWSVPSSASFSSHVDLSSFRPPSLKLSTHKPRPLKHDQPWCTVTIISHHKPA